MHLPDQALAIQTQEPGIADGTGGHGTGRRAEQ